MPGLSWLKVKTFLTRVGIFSSIIFILHTAPVISGEILDNPISSDDEIEAELKYLQEETYAITGTRIPQLIGKTAYSIFVVTDKEIRQMGARFLTDVVPIVPGWHVSVEYSGMLKITSHGGGTFRSGEIMVLINNHPSMTDGRVVSPCSIICFP